MNAIILVLLLMATYSEAYSQIIEAKNSWNYLEVLIPTCEKSTNCEGKFYINYNYKIGSDTLINNKVYAKVIETSIRNNDSISYSCISGFLREEENHKKVYIQLSYLDDSTEVLLYDFTIKKDSIFNSTYESLYHLPDGDKIVKSTYYSSQVIDIDSVLYLGIKRLRIKLLDFRTNWIDDNPAQDTVEWIEGIGSNKGLLNYIAGDYYLLCFKQYDEVTFTNKFGLDCNYSGPLTKIGNHVVKEICIYPNPLKGETLNISSPILISSIFIYNVSGELVGQYYPRNTNFQMQLNHLRCGFYIIKADKYFYKLIIE
jgi:hypothetical protein